MKVIASTVLCSFCLLTLFSIRFCAAFYFALRDTLVAPNLDAAMKIAYQGKQRFRVVTLDGSVIDTSGMYCLGKRRDMRVGQRHAFLQFALDGVCIARSKTYRHKQAEK
jgi:structural maintenance of chromosome 4